MMTITHFLIIPEAGYVSNQARDFWFSFKA